jgi:hypothetical protein
MDATSSALNSLPYNPRVEELVVVALDRVRGAIKWDSSAAAGPTPPGQSSTLSLHPHSHWAASKLIVDVFQLPFALGALDSVLSLHHPKFDLNSLSDIIRRMWAALSQTFPESRKTRAGMFILNRHPAVSSRLCQSLSRLLSKFRKHFPPDQRALAVDLVAIFDLVDHLLFPRPLEITAMSAPELALRTNLVSLVSEARLWSSLTCELAICRRILSPTQNHQTSTDWSFPSLSFDERTRIICLSSLFLSGKLSLSALQPNDLPPTMQMILKSPIDFTFTSRRLENVALALDARTLKHQLHNRPQPLTILEVKNRLLILNAHSKIPLPQSTDPTSRSEFPKSPNLSLPENRPTRWAAGLSLVKDASPSVPQLIGKWMSIAVYLYPNIAARSLSSWLS